MRIRFLGLIVILALLEIVSITTSILNNHVGLYQQNIFQTPNLNVKELAQYYSADSNDKWVRENAYINDNISLDQGYGYEIKSNTLISNSLNAKPKKILIFGDSFLWGNGNTDLSSTLFSILYRELNSYKSPPVYEIKILAQPGKSTFNYYDLFKNNILAQYKPDILIYAYHGNDYMPSFNESLICNNLSLQNCQKNNARTNPAYQNCLHGEGDLLPRFFKKTLNKKPNLMYQLIVRYCEPLYLKAAKVGYDQDKYANDPTRSPYYGKWLQTLKLLKKEVAPSEIIVANLTSDYSTLETNKFLEKKMSQAGYKVVPMVETRKAVYSKDYSSNKAESLTHINIVNDHPSSYLNYQYAKDIINYLKNKNLIDKDIKSLISLSNHNKPKGNIITHTMPYFDIINKPITENSSIVTFNSELFKKYRQQIPTNNNLPFQYTNCMNLGYANFQFTLSEEASKGELKISNIPKNKKFAFGFYYYDKEYVRKYQPLRTNQKNVYSIPNSNHPVDLIISFPEYSINCPIDKEINAPNFSITITHQQ